jgi:subtilisin family serine protease
MEQREYIITVTDPGIWSEVWDLFTKDGLGDNFIPQRAVEVINDRPFNDYIAHFNLTDEEAAELKQDHRFASVELKAELQDDVEKGFLGARRHKFDKTYNIDNTMKNWGLLRSTQTANPFNSSLSVTGDYNYNLDGTGVDIIVMDSGVMAGHPEFAVNADGTGGSRVVDFNWASLGVPGVPTGASIGGYLGDSDGHGSHCASIAAGNTCGWAPGAAIYSIRVFSGQDTLTGSFLGEINSDLAFDLVRAFHLRKVSQGSTRPTICTNSWGYRSSYSSMQYTVWRETQYNNTFRNSAYGQVNSLHPYILNYLNVSVNNAAAAGVIMVGAAGNYYHKIDVPGGVDYNNYYRYNYFNFYTEDIYYHRGSSPTGASSMINVGAIDNTGTEQKAVFSETGPGVDIYAAGVAVMAAYANDIYVTGAVADPRNSAYHLNKLAGTSMACPQVTGMLACVLQARPNMTPAEAKAFIVEHSVKNTLQVSGAENYSNQRSLQGGNNRILKTPFTSPVRGGINSI